MACLPLKLVAFGKVIDVSQIQALADLPSRKC